MFNHCKIRSKCEHTSDTSHSSLQCIGVEKNLFGVKSGEMHQAENGGGARPWVFALWCSLLQRLTSLSLITLEIMSYSFHHYCQHIDLWAPARQCTSTFSPLFILSKFRWPFAKKLDGWKLIYMWNKSPVLIPLSVVSHLVVQICNKMYLEEQMPTKQKVLKQVLLTGTTSTLEGLYIYFFCKILFQTCPRESFFFVSIFLILRISLHKSNTTKEVELWRTANTKVSGQLQ